MMTWLFYWMLRRRWNLTALDLAVSEALDLDVTWATPKLQEEWHLIQSDVLRAKR